MKKRKIPRIVKSKVNNFDLGIVLGEEFEVVMVYARGKYLWYQMKQGDKYIDAPKDMFKTISS